MLLLLIDRNCNCERVFSIMAQGKKRANAEGYEQFIRKDGSKDWRPTRKRASEGSQVHSDLKADFAADTSHLDDIEDIDFNEDDILDNEVDELLNDDIDDDEVEQLLREDLESGIDNYDDYGSSNDDSYDYYEDDDDYREGFGEYGDLSEKSRFNDDLDNYYDSSYDRGRNSDYYDEWN